MKTAAENSGDNAAPEPRVEAAATSGSLSADTVWSFGAVSGCLKTEGKNVPDFDGTDMRWQDSIYLKLR